MIIGAVALLKMVLFGSGAGVEALLPADFNHRVEMYVTEENKADDIKKIIKIMNDNVEKYNDKLEKHLEKIYEINSDYLSTASDISDEVAEMSKLKVDIMKDLLVMRSKIRDLVTEEQWNKLFDRTKETVE